MTEIDVAKAEALRAAAQQRYTAIRNNPDLSEVRAQTLLAQVWVKLRDDLATMSRDATSAQKSEKEKLAFELYGLPTGGDLLGYRDGLQYAKKLGDRTSATAVEDLMKAYEDARITGDDLMVRAILKTTFDNRFAAVITAWQADHLKQAADAERLWDLTGNRAASANFYTMMALVAPKPTELSAMSDDQITVIAARPATES